MSSICYQPELEEDPYGGGVPFVPPAVAQSYQSSHDQFGGGVPFVPSGGCFGGPLGGGGIQDIINGAGEDPYGGGIPLVPPAVAQAAGGGDWFGSAASAAEDVFFDMF